jgi:2-polyprenyl-3-methyl-5-hydroxy-6-metoxy-1,4-benzoquinol methylase
MKDFKSLAKYFRRLLTFWISNYNLEHLHNIRQAEFNYITNYFPKSLKTVLEIGAGTGWQSKLLSDLNYKVCAIDLPTSNYSNNRVWEITDYDGSNIPFDNQSFDIVFSSNVMEHILHLNQIQNEIYRVLNNDGVVIHVMPTSSWRILTNITHIIKFWTKPTVHGVHSSNIYDEKFFFSENNWLSILNNENFSVENVVNIPILYSGNSILGGNISLKIREFFSKYFGGSCNIYILKKRKYD